MKGRGVPSGYVEGLNDARTMLATFFSILRARLVSAVYLVLEDGGVVVAVLEVPELVLDGVLAGTDEGGEAGVAGAVDVVCSDVLGAGSFFSSVLAIGASLPAEGFILSE